MANIRFTHEYICPEFRDGRKLTDTIDQLRRGLTTFRDIPPLYVARCRTPRGDIYLSKNNCFKEAGVRYADVNKIHISRIADWAFTSKNGGVSVAVKRDSSHMHRSKSEIGRDKTTYFQILHEHETLSQH